MWDKVFFYGYVCDPAALLRCQGLGVKIHVESLSVPGAGQGCTGDTGWSHSAGACFCACARPNALLGCWIPACVHPGPRVATAALGKGVRLCLTRLAPAAATCARTAVGSQTSPDPGPKAGLGAGPAARRDVVGAVLILAKATPMGEAPGSRPGGTKNGKAGDGGMQRWWNRRKRSRTGRASQGRGADVPRQDPGLRQEP